MEVFVAVLSWLKDDVPGTTLELYRGENNDWTWPVLVLVEAGGRPRLHSIFGREGIAYWGDRDNSSYRGLRIQSNLCPGHELYDIIKMGSLDGCGFATWDDQESFEHWVALCEGRTVEMPEMVPPVWGSLV